MKLSLQEKMDLLGVIQTGLIDLSFYLSIENDVHRLIGLVQDNQDFFGDPPAGESCIKLAADKLEELIKASKTVKPGTEAICRECGNTIRYVGPFWEHLGVLQPRHPAWPKEDNQ
jgi:hypothetical protein